MGISEVELLILQHITGPEAHFLVNPLCTSQPEIYPFAAHQSN